MAGAGAKVYVQCMTLSAPTFDVNHIDLATLKRYAWPMKRSSSFTDMSSACIVLTLLACSRDASQSSGRETTFRSEGDTIVAMVGADANEPSHTLVEEMRIGDDSGRDEYTFGRISEVAVAPNGNIYVWDAQDQEIRMYDSTGAYIRQIGRKGAGPGEYDRLNGLSVRQDGKLVAWDAGNARVNVYSPDGEYETQWPFNASYFSQHSVFTDTANNTYLRATARLDSTKILGVMGLVRLDMGGQIRDSLVPPSLGADPPSLVARANGGTSSYTVPGFPQTSWAMSPLGYWVASPGDPYVINLMRAHQRPIRIERSVSGPRFEPEERDQRREFTMWALRRTDPAFTWTGPDIPDNKPAIMSISVGADGRVWARLSQPAERIPQTELPPVGPTPKARTVPPISTWQEPTAFDVYSPEGEYLGHVKAPARAAIYQMRGDRVWASALDSNDIPGVVRFRVEPPLTKR